MQEDLAWLLHRVTGVQWWALAAALVCHASAVSLHVLAWRTILAHEYGPTNVRFRHVFGGYAAGSALNAFVPAGPGVALKLFIIRNHIRGASYAALAATLAALAAFDVVVTTAIAAWAMRTSLLPDLQGLADDRAFLGRHALDHPLATTVGVAAAASMAVVLGAALHRRLRRFAAEFVRGLRVLADPGFYLTRVVPVQAVNWIAQLAAIAFFLTAFNLAPTVRNVLLVQAAKSLAVLVPFAPSGAGAQFGLLMLALNGRARALTVAGFAIGMRLTTTAFNVSFGAAAIVLILRTLRWRRVLDAGAAARAGAAAEVGGERGASGYAASSPIPSATTPAPRHAAQV